MKREDIILVGGGGHARVIYGSLIRLNRWNIVGYTDVEKKDLDGLEYLGTDDTLGILAASVKSVVVGIGQTKSYRVRYSVYMKLKDLGFSFPSVISESAVVMQKVTTGEGTYIGENTYLGPNVTIGVMSIVNTGAIIEHESRIGDFVHVAINASLAGKTEVGMGSLIGMGSSVLNGVHVGEQVLVGAGTVVRKHVDRKALIYGNPSKMVRNYFEE
jgi:UDP-perosamine 4-acetyltransferase